MIEMWLVYRTLKKYFDMVAKPNNCELPIAEKKNFHSFALNLTPMIGKYLIVVFASIQLICYGPDVPIAKSSRLDFLIRK